MLDEAGAVKGSRWSAKKRSACYVPPRLANIAG
jgi:hypothetical protein